MKTLLIIGTLLILAGAMLASSTGVSGAWMVQSGLIFLFGALAVSAKEKIVGERNFITCCCFDGRFVPMGFREWHVVYASSRRNHKYYRRGLGYLSHYKK